jgi:hypothetical protein
MVYNPLDHEIKRQIDVPVYYTGLASRAIVGEQDERPVICEISRDYTVNLTVTIPARGYNYYIIR